MLDHKLQKLQNRAARVITKSPFDTSSNHLCPPSTGRGYFFDERNRKP